MYNIIYFHIYILRKTVFTFLIHFCLWDMDLAIWLFYISLAILWIPIALWTFRQKYIPTKLFMALGVIKLYKFSKPSKPYIKTSAMPQKSYHFVAQYILFESNMYSSTSFVKTAVSFWYAAFSMISMLPSKT